MTHASFAHAQFQLADAWTSPFVRWQGSLQNVHSLDLAVDVTMRGFAERQIDPTTIGEVVLGWTVPQQRIFYGAPTLAARIGAPCVTGAMVSQACATSVAGLAAAGRTMELGADSPVLVVMTDRTSNGPLINYPSPANAGGAPTVENWCADNFEFDPWGGMSMAETAEAVAREAGISRAECDDVTILRHEQYRSSLVNDREFQRRFMVGAIAEGRRKRHLVEADEGIYELDANTLRSLQAQHEGGVVTRDTQTHPADGVAGVILRPTGSISGQRVRIHSVGFARAERGRMPRAVVPAAFEALQAADVALGDVHLMNTHNPFVVSDIWFARETGYPIERMNTFGCSLVYGHPQAPTGLRAVIELAHALAQRGGGIGLFTGCAAGDSAGAVVIEVDGD